MLKYTDLIGVPFADGGRSLKTGFDCYGLVMEVFKRCEKEIPEYFAPAFDDGLVNTQVKAALCSGWQEIERANLTVPSVVLFRFNSPLPNHVGVYIGNGCFLHCRNPIGVNIDRIDSPAWRHRVEAFYIYERGE